MTTPSPPEGKVRPAVNSLTLVGLRRVHATLFDLPVDDSVAGWQVADQWETAQTWLVMMFRATWPVIPDGPTFSSSLPTLLVQRPGKKPVGLHFSDLVREIDWDTLFHVIARGWSLACLVALWREDADWQTVEALTRANADGLATLGGLMALGPLPGPDWAVHL